MTDRDLIAILRHYAALPDRACPAAVLVEAAARLTDGEIKRRPRRPRAEPENLLQPGNPGYQPVDDGKPAIPPGDE